MVDASSESLHEWIGRTHAEEDHLSLFPARGMAALLDDDPLGLEIGSALPHGWHWLYFKPTTPRSELGSDGHARRGAFLPPVSLPRRMWAGGRFRFHAPLHLGDTAERVSTIRDITSKQGRSGPLVFVTVQHRVCKDGESACDEEQDIVYRDATSSSNPPANALRLTEPVAWRDEFTADRVALFRFSALTFNGHRIHYDQPYAIAEGYPDLVVHGPLIALLLLRSARRHASGRALAAFEYRAVSPLLVGQTILLQGERRQGDAMRLWATDAAGRIAMEATGRW